MVKQKRQRLPPVNFCLSNSHRATPKMYSFNIFSHVIGESFSIESEFFSIEAAMTLNFYILVSLAIG